MARLPVVAGDLDNWGTILNQFLTVSHASDGRLFVTNPTTSAVPLTVQGAASQTADLVKIQNSASTDLVTVDAAGILKVGPALALDSTLGRSSYIGKTFV